MISPAVAAALIVGGSSLGAAALGSSGGKKADGLSGAEQAVLGEQAQNLSLQRQIAQRLFQAHEADVLPVQALTGQELAVGLQGGVPAPIATGLEQIQEAFTRIEPNIRGLAVSTAEEERTQLRERILAATERGGLQQFGLGQAEAMAELARERFFQTAALAQAQNEINFLAPAFQNLLPQTIAFATGQPTGALGFAQAANQGLATAGTIATTGAQRQLTQNLASQESAGAIGGILSEQLVNVSNAIKADQQQQSRVTPFAINTGAQTGTFTPTNRTLATIGRR